MTVKIQLSEAEILLAGFLTAMRQSINRQAGIVNQKAGPQDPITTEQVGLYGELAFAKWANLYPDLTTHLRTGSADAVYKGWTVDVKSTRNLHGDLYADVRRGKLADLYVLVYTNYATCELLGWLWSGDVLALTKSKTAPYLVRQGALNDIRYFEEIEPKA